jgi:hypothetical protein
MRVTIQIDDEETSVSRGAAREEPRDAQLTQAQAGDAATDAGAGPGGAGVASTTGAADDTGGPPGWLVEAVARAEAEAGAPVTEAAVADDGTDAGEGPQG